MTALEVQDVSHAVLQPLSLRLQHGQSLVLCGPSGSGKTTLLRLVAGLEPLRSGQIVIFGQDAASLAPHQRQLAMVFQSLALWPHLTVRDNLRLGGVLPDRLESVSASLGIQAFLPRYPDQLSGGERQRVALARALGTPAQLLLLDEPLSQLDTALRAQLLEVLASERGRRSLLYVTHNAQEALRMADQILFLERGLLVQAGPPEALLTRPASEAVAHFFGLPFP